MPIPFTKPNDLPIVGQPMKVNTWFPTVSIICNCEAQQPLLLVGFRTLAVCPECRRGFRLLAAIQDVRDGKPPHFHVDVVIQAETGQGSEQPN